MPIKIVSLRSGLPNRRTRQLCHRNTPAKRRAKRRPGDKHTPWHGELVMMPDFWQTAQEPDDE